MTGDTFRATFLAEDVDAFAAHPCVEVFTTKDQTPNVDPGLTKVSFRLTAD